MGGRLQLGPAGRILWGPEVWHRTGSQLEQPAWYRIAFLIVFGICSIGVGSRHQALSIRTCLPAGSAYLCEEQPAALFLLASGHNITMDGPRPLQLGRHPSRPQLLERQADLGTTHPGGWSSCGNERQDQGTRKNALAQGDLSRERKERRKRRKRSPGEREGRWGGGGASEPRHMSASFLSDRSGLDRIKRVGGSGYGYLFMFLTGLDYILTI